LFIPETQLRGIPGDTPPNQRKNWKDQNWIIAKYGDKIYRLPAHHNTAGKLTANSQAADTNEKLIEFNFKCILEITENNKMRCCESAGHMEIQEDALEDLQCFEIISKNNKSLQCKENKNIKVDSIRECSKS